MLWLHVPNPVLGPCILFTSPIRWSTANIEHPMKQNSEHLLIPSFHAKWERQRDNYGGAAALLAGAHVQWIDDTLASIELSPARVVGEGLRRRPPSDRSASQARWWVAIEDHINSVKPWSLGWCWFGDQWWPIWTHYAGTMQVVSSALKLLRWQLKAFREEFPWKVGLN
jgi:hypothetical protein